MTTSCNREGMPSQHLCAKPKTRGSKAVHPTVCGQKPPCHLPTREVDCKGTHPSLPSARNLTSPPEKWILRIHLLTLSHLQESGSGVPSAPPRKRILMVHILTLSWCVARNLLCVTSPPGKRILRVHIRSTHSSSGSTGTFRLIASRTACINHRGKINFAWRVL